MGSLNGARGISTGPEIREGAKWKEYRSLKRQRLSEAVENDT